MSRESTSRGRGPGRAQRADAVRNRERVVEAARRVFTTHGPDVSVREVAREAGVGLGTIYRHFPDKESLLAGVVEQRLTGLVGETRQAMAELPPWEAFTGIMRRMAEMMTEDRSFAGAIAAARAPRPGDPDEPDDLDARVWRDRARRELDEALAELARSAQQAGELRGDVGPLELGLLLAGVGLSLGPADPDGGPLPDPPPWEGYLAVVLDGLRERSRGARE